MTEPAIPSARPKISIGIPGLYVTEDPGAVDNAAKQGNLSMRFGLGWAKAQSFHTGQTPVVLNGVIAVLMVVGAFMMRFARQRRSR